MEKSDEGKKAPTLELLSKIAQNFNNILGPQSKIPIIVLPQDPAKESLESDTDQEPTRFGAGTHTDAGTSSSNTCQEPQMGVSTSNAGTSRGALVGDIEVVGAGTDEGASIGGHRFTPGFALIDTIQQGTGYIRSMAANLDGVLFTGSDSKLVGEWHKGHQFASFKSSSGPIYAIVLQYPEAHIFCAHNGGMIRVWERNIISQGVFFKPIRTLTKLRDLLKKPFFPRAVSCLCLSDDGNFIYSGSVDHTVNVWHIRRWEHVETIRNHKGAINALAMGPQVVFSGSSDGTIKMWERELYGKKRDKVRHLLRVEFTTTKDVMVNAVLFGMVGSSSGFLYAGSSDGDVRFWKDFQNLPDKPEVFMRFHKGAVNCLALCSGSFVFSGSADMTISVWRREDEGEFHTHVMVLRGHSGPVCCIQTQEDWEEDVTGPNQWVLYSGSLDRTLKVWRVYDHTLPKQ